MPDFPSPYNILYEDGVYFFVTDHQRKYSCLFNNITSILPPVVGIYDIEVYIFDFFFNDPSPSRKPGDDRVSETIKHLINEFFENKNRVIIYVCDTVDGRGKQRDKLFKRWYQNVADSYVRDDLEIKMIDADTIYGSVIRSVDFPHDEILKLEVIEEAQGFIMEKYCQ